MEVYKLWLLMTLGSQCLNAIDIVKSEITPKEFYENRKNWHEYPFFTTKQMSRALCVPLEEAERVLQIHKSYNIETTCYCDDEYPESFKMIPDAPLALFYKGDIRLLKEDNIVGVIGARHPDRDGLQICENIATDLARNGVIIVSGLAQGLDGAAHMAALAANGKTIAFIGTALDKTYPSNHKALQEEIAKNGCVISEYYIGVPTPAVTFLERNRLIAASSQAVCVIQAKSRSGSLATARNAIEYEKQLFAVPGNITNPIYDGANRLIQNGAIPLIKAQDVLNFLEIGIECKKARVPKPKLKLSEEEQRIYNCLHRQTKSTNQIFSETRIPIIRLKALLTKLEMDRIIFSQSAGVYYIK